MHADWQYVEPLSDDIRPGYFHAIASYWPSTWNSSVLSRLVGSKKGISLINCNPSWSPSVHGLHVLSAVSHHGALSYSAIRSCACRIAWQKLLNSAFTWALNLYPGEGMLYAFIGYPFNILVDIIVSLCPVPSCPVCCALMFSPRDSPLVCLSSANDLAVSVDKSY